METLPQRIGRYQVRELLGAGTQGEVFRASLSGPMGFKKDVAIKRIHPRLLGGPLEQRLIREARLGGLLRHTNIVEAYELEKDDHGWYIAMAYVDGMSLQDILDHARAEGVKLPAVVCLEIAEQVCQGLQYAHTLDGGDGEPLGIVHRDLKPGNLMLASDGTIKILDFGIAKLVHSSEQLTGTGGQKGSPAYMSPEQADGDSDIRASSDIFSLGSVIYELLSNELLFQGEGALATMYKIIWDEPGERLAALDDRVPGLSAVLARALAKSPQDRWPSAGALGDELRSLREGMDERATARDLAAALMRGEDPAGRDPMLRPFVRAAPSGQVPSTDGDPVERASGSGAADPSGDGAPDPTGKLRSSDGGAVAAPRGGAVRARRPWRPGRMLSLLLLAGLLSGVGYFANHKEAFRPADWWSAVAGGRAPGGAAGGFQRKSVEPAMLAVLSDPPARVDVDGKDFGVTPILKGLDPGTHRVRLRCTACRPHASVDFTLILKAGQTETINHSF
jgi:serine/threonine-protein kinase